MVCQFLCSAIQENFQSIVITAVGSVCLCEIMALVESEIMQGDQ